MTHPLGLVVLAIAGLAAGAINAAVGSGTLISYPALLAIGLAPIPANATNNVGVLFGSMSATYSYRSLLRGRVRTLAPALVLAFAGSVGGAELVLLLPEHVFKIVIPWLILFATASVALGGRTTRLVRRRYPHAHKSGHALATLAAPVGAYGGYFGAAQGVILMALLGVFYDEDPQAANAAKNLLAATANAAAAIVFAFSGRVHWGVAAILAVSATLGGLTGGALARRASPALLRALVIVVGLIAAISLLVAN